MFLLLAAALTIPLGLDLYLPVPEHNPLTAEKIAVLNGGALTSPVVRAARIEVSPGGSFQALIEKYVPREAPKEPEAEAA